MNENKLNILIAEDDDDDFFFLKKALEQCHFIKSIYRVMDGQELVDYLLKKKQFSGNTSPMPNIIITDINMPRLNGIEAIKEIKTNSELKKIPTLVYTTSKADGDINKSYEYGACSYINKPSSLEDLTKITEGVSMYWGGMVTLPTIA